MDNYKVIQYINKGSFGKIYSVERNDKEKYAMKTIKIFGIDRYQRISILTELKILLTNNSNYLLKCHDVFTSKNRLCIITEYVDGGDLDQYIKKRKVLGLDEITKIFLKICVGINVLHTNQIVHRDIKPANILMTKTGDVKICDFGICKFLDYNKVTNTMVGTPYFMSPEQMYERHYDYKCDVWGIGCVLFVMLYGKPPFNARNMHELKRNIQTKDPLIGVVPRQAALHGIVKEMLDKSKNRRPDLQTFLKHDSNAKLLQYYSISNDTKTFRKYSINSIPSTDSQWNSILKKARADFKLPYDLYNRTVEILNSPPPKSTIKPTQDAPALVPFSAIKKGMVKPPEILPRNKIAKINPDYRRDIIARASFAKRSPPIHVQYPRPQVSRTPQPDKCIPIAPPRRNPYSVAEIRRSSPAPDYPAAKYPQIKKPNTPYRPLPTKPCIQALPLPSIKNRYRNVQSKVKQRWFPNVHNKYLKK